MEMNKNKKILVTHDGTFHSDDIFACATLSLLLEQKNESFEIIRTRDEAIIATSDYVFDVGGIYNEESNKFDHHQINTPDKRKNGIPYAAFGLVWKKFGAELCTSQIVAATLDKVLVQPIDAKDNGVDILEPLFPDIVPYTINSVFAIFLPTALEQIDKDSAFLEAVQLAKKILSREIKKGVDALSIQKMLQDRYHQSPNKSIILIEEPKVSRQEIWDALQDFTDVFFVIYKATDSWNVVAMRKERNSFENRKNLPQSWAGLTGEALQKITTVQDALFCHKNLFLTSAVSKEGAIQLAELALNN